MKQIVSTAARRKGAPMHKPKIPRSPCHKCSMGRNCTLAMSRCGKYKRWFCAAWHAVRVMYGRER